MGNHRGCVVIGQADGKPGRAEAALIADRQADGGADLGGGTSALRPQDPATLAQRSV
jgi:hypothetical protein